MTRSQAVAWGSLAVQIGIVATGGAVRLTGSGLGCPTWPQCTPESFVVQPELGIHGAIEFGNRMLTFVLALVASLAIRHTWRRRHERRDLFQLAVTLGAGIPAQAVLGGLTVLTGLNPWLVGAHFVLSAMLVMVATMFVSRTYTPAHATGPVPPWSARVAYVMAIAVALTVILGVITTGAGPHAGDAATPRNGLRPETLQAVHSASAYVAFALTAWLVVSTASRRDRASALAQTLLAVEVAQIAVGMVQARLQLPAWLVGIHMVLACLLVAAMTAALLNLREDRIRATRMAASAA